MPTINFTDAQRAQLIGWLNREKDFLLSIESLSRRVLLPKATGSISLIGADLQLCIDLRDKLRSSEELVVLTDDECEALLAVAESNEYEDRRELWEGVSQVIREAKG